MSMPNIDVKITDNSKHFKDELKSKMPKILEEVGLVAEGYAKKACAVDTGRLRNSTTHAVSDNSVFIGTDVEYGPYVELGTVNTPAQPFLRPAAYEHGPIYQQIIENGLKE